MRFTETARSLGAAIRSFDLVVPAFRCPPRVPGVLRTIRRYPDGAVISVVLRNRPFDEVLGDMIEGVLVVNQLHGEEALRTRTALLAALAAPVGTSTPVPEPATQLDPDHPAIGVASPEVRVAERQTRAA